MCKNLQVSTDYYHFEIHAQPGWPKCTQGQSKAKAAMEMKSKHHQGNAKCVRGCDWRQPLMVR